MGEKNLVQKQHISFLAAPSVIGIRGQGLFYPSLNYPNKANFLFQKPGKERFQSSKNLEIKNLNTLLSAFISDH